jgi:hypothetical protein
VLDTPIDISWIVENQGIDTAAGYWYDRVYLSDDPFLDASDTYTHYVRTKKIEVDAAQR